MHFVIYSSASIELPAKIYVYIMRCCIIHSNEEEISLFPEDFELSAINSSHNLIIKMQQTCVSVLHALAVAQINSL